MGFLLHTARLTLSHFSHDDAGFILALLNDPAFIQNIGDRNVRTLDDARAYLDNGPLRSYAVNGFGLYRVTLRGTPDAVAAVDDTAAPGAVIGMCGLIKRDALPDVDLGYAFLPRYWGAGYAPEAGAAVLAYARETLKLPRVVAIVDPLNTPSIRVLERLGLWPAGVVRLADDDIELLHFATADWLHP